MSIDHRTLPPLTSRMHLVMNPYRLLSIVLIILLIYKVSAVVRAIASIFEGWKGER